MNNLYLGLSVAALTTSSPAMAAFVVDTGAPAGGGANYVLDPGTSLAGLFTLSAATTINSVEGFINGGAGDPSSITIFGNGPTPSAANVLFTATFTTIVSPSPGAWQGVFGKSWTLGPGNYWVGFASSGPQGMFGNDAPNPLSAYAFTSNGNWFQSPLGFGVRIAGVQGNIGAVPESATWAMMITGFGLVGGMMRRRVAKSATPEPCDKETVEAAFWQDADLAVGIGS